ncbi:MAG: nuclear transport factor 2 family protein [Chloroflexota bacterium]|nr:nuclear transport factor 2 family protein [Chloroflexota bacterium]
MMLRDSKRSSHLFLLLLSLCWISVAVAKPETPANQTEKTRALTLAYFERLSNADRSVADFWDKRTVLFVNNDGPWGGYYRGTANIAQYYRDMADMFDMDNGIRFELLQTAVEGNHSILHFRVQGQHIAGEYDNHYIQVYYWGDDGKLSKIENFYGWAPFLHLQRQAAENRASH